MNKREYALFKRCFEYYSADGEFRKTMDESPAEAVKSLGYGDELDAEAVRGAVRYLCYREGSRSNPYLNAMYEVQRAPTAMVEKSHARGSFRSEDLYHYLRNQRNRCSMESKLIRGNTLVQYFPFAVELCRGCSVQCPFCGFAAESFKGYFAYTPENAALFRGIVTAAEQLIGPCVGHCPMYFATEPLDNPDYERFALDFRSIAGNVPQITTAVADMYPERIRRWIDQLGEDYVHANASFRFSIRTLPQFRRIMAEYDPEELTYVEVLANDPESANAYSDSGRVMSGLPRCEEKKRRYSICCVSGLKVNMLTQTVEFVEPELPDELYPLGYRVLERRQFETAEDFAHIAAELMERYAIAHLPTDRPLCLNRNVELTEKDGLFLFVGDETGYKLGKNRFTEAIVEQVRNGGTFDAALAPWPLSDGDRRKLYLAADELFSLGYIRILHCDI